MEPAIDTRTPDEVTVVWSRQARPGLRAELESVVDRIGKALTTAPGYVNAAILRPPPGQAPLFTMVVHFESQADLDAWVSSETRGRLYAEAERVSIGGLNVQQAAGLEGWFQMPGQPLVVPPPRYKMAAVTWLALFPMLVVANLIATPLLGRFLPLVRLVPVSLILVALMTWYVMPQMTRWFRFWLYPKPAADAS